MMTEKLKPCPFCGGEARVRIEGLNLAIASCSHCHAVQQVFSRPHADTSLSEEQYLSGAAKLWNSRFLLA